MNLEANSNTQTIILRNETGNAIGIASFVFGVISIFVLAPVFVPLGLLFGVIGIIKKQMVWSVIGLICSIVGFLTSPILLGLFGLVSVGASI